MVPVIDRNNNPLMPCTEKRARQRMERGQAKPFWNKGIFCIKLFKVVNNPQFQDVILGIDPGSKREGYTVATNKAVVVNITSNTPYWIKDNVETRRTLRRSRRYRKTPYRKCRSNRSALKQERLPPSTKARWNAKIRVIKFLKKILPINKICVEDIKAKSKEGEKAWNKSFSPLEVGKKWFYNQIVNLGFELKLAEGHETGKKRESRGFEKSKSKLNYDWNCHNIDSHVLCELMLNRNINPYFGIWKLEFLRFYRRQLHVQNPIKGNIRKPYGSTVSMGMSRGSVLRYKKDNKLYYLGGSSKDKVSIHSIETGKRVKQFVKMENIDMLYTNKWRIQYLNKGGNSSPEECLKAIDYIFNSIKTVYGFNEPEDSKLFRKAKYLNQEVNDLLCDTYGKQAEATMTNDDWETQSVKFSKNKLYVSLGYDTENDVMNKREDMRRRRVMLLRASIAALESIKKDLE